VVWSRSFKYPDMRIKMLNAILAGIPIIQLYAWERPFGTRKLVVCTHPVGLLVIHWSGFRR
jgi:hypothetical protein